ncbi:hypothetical protein BSK66_15855 [Paenibacillus odorifer]|uniref:Uncharacterized protein n=1 Tax=Paenibacillus odorifer TaxID=189426 RepID=A0A1R0X0A3_9BACL|nr:hypothetical protein [Paenibacillus odorifer]ETT55231.1 hypothetical protein C171_19627 [Paenibacillus sp. FSL H8-237]OMD25434.1 hypothetical protein BJP51_04070 [Paenibacillus odorifer]OME56323.1 hypothetical protein BSK66_15855 [Paenibacillus odorifer]
MTVIICSTVRCPYPTCGHTGEVITVNHCRTAHNMERKELFRKYGKPQSIGYDPQAANKNLEGHTPIQRLNIGYPSDSNNAKDRRSARSKGR